MKNFLALIVCLLTIFVVFAACGKKEPEASEKTTEETEKVYTQTNVDDKGYLDGTYSYIILEDGTAKITKYNLEDRVDYPIYIPSKLGDKDVTVIGEAAFKDCKTIREIHFPKSLVTIENDAFRGSSLADAEMYICSNLKSIGDNAFADCSELVKIDLVSKIENFGNGVFANCPSLKFVTLRGNFTNLDMSLFDKSGKFTVYTQEDSADTIKFAKDNGYEIKYL